MAEWWPFDRSRTDEWKRTWTEIISRSSAAAAAIGLPQPGTLAGDPFAVLVAAARAWLTGKSETFRFSGHDLTLTLSDISMDGATSPGSSTGAGKVHISTRDVQWHVYQFERIDIRASNVRVRPGTRLDAEWHAGSLRGLHLGLVRLQLAGHRVAPPGAGHGETASRRSAWLACRGPGWKWKRASRAAPSACGRAPFTCSTGACLCGPQHFRLTLPELPAGFMLTSVEPAQAGFLVRGLFSQWQWSLSRDDVERLLAGMRAGQDRLDVATVSPSYTDGTTSAAYFRRWRRHDTPGRSGSRRNRGGFLHAIGFFEGMDRVPFREMDLAYSLSLMISPDFVKTCPSGLRVLPSDSDSTSRYTTDDIYSVASCRLLPDQLRSQSA